MALGTVKMFDDSKGFGFITVDETGEDIFAHFAAINIPGYKALTPGQRVSFYISHGSRGKQANDIQAA